MGGCDGGWLGLLLPARRISMLPAVLMPPQASARTHAPRGPCVLPENGHHALARQKNGPGNRSLKRHWPRDRQNFCFPWGLVYPHGTQATTARDRGKGTFGAESA